MAAAASALPPPRPAWVGMRFATWTWIRGISFPVCSARSAAAFQIRFFSPVGKKRTSDEIVNSFSGVSVKVSVSLDDGDAAAHAVMDAVREKLTT